MPLKRKALRRGIWFKALSRVERSIYDLTIRAVDTIKSEKLLQIIKTIVTKLREALESPVSVLTRTIGRQLAEQLAHIAYSWGYQRACEWTSDDSFAKYLAVCCMNLPAYYKEQFIPS